MLANGTSSSAAINLSGSENEDVIRAEETPKADASVPFSEPRDDSHEPSDSELFETRSSASSSGSPTTPRHSDDESQAVSEEEGFDEIGSESSDSQDATAHEQGGGGEEESGPAFPPLTISVTPADGEDEVSDESLSEGRESADPASTSEEAEPESEVAPDESLSSGGAESDVAAAGEDVVFDSPSRPTSATSVVVTKSDEPDPDAGPDMMPEDAPPASEADDDATAEEAEAEVEGEGEDEGELEPLPTYRFRPLNAFSSLECPNGSFRIYSGLAPKDRKKSGVASFATFVTALEGVFFPLFECLDPRQQQQQQQQQHQQSHDPMRGSGGRPLPKDEEEVSRMEIVFLEFLGAFRKFCSQSRFASEQMLRGSVISERLGHLGIDFGSGDAREASNDDTVVAKVEKFINFATGCIRDVLDEVTAKPKASALEGVGPLAEMQYWREVAAKLGTIWVQIMDPRIQFLKDILLRDEYHATLLEMFESQSHELTKNSVRAKDNVKFLETLERHFKCIDRCDVEVSLLPILDTLPSLLRALRMVWIISRHYNTEKQMVPLMVLIANEIIRKVLGRLKVKRTLESLYENPENAIALFREGAAVLRKWKDAYVDVRNDETQRELRWDFDVDKLFGRTEYIRSRLEDLISIAEHIRKCKMFLSPSLVGSMTASSKLLATVRSEIQDLLDPILAFCALNPNRMFDSQEHPQWREVMKAVRARLIRVENRLNEFIAKCFDRLPSAQKAFRLLRDVQKMTELTRSWGTGVRVFDEDEDETEGATTSSKRSVSTFGVSASLLHERTLQVLSRFGTELDDIKAIFEAEQDNPPRPKNMPASVARIYWADSLFGNIRSTVMTIRAEQRKTKSVHDVVVGRRRTSGQKGSQSQQAKAVDLFESSHEGRRVKDKCLRLSRAIIDYVHLNFRQWAEKVEQQALECLKKTILDGDFRHLRRMRVNFDPRLILMMQETKYLERVVSESPCFQTRAQSQGRGGSPPPRIPEIAMNITLQSDKYHGYCEDLKSMIDHLRRMIRPLGRHERGILRPKLRQVISVLEPGFTMLNWNSLGISDYLQKCNGMIAEFQGIVRKVQKNVAILNGLIHSIASTNLFVDPVTLEGRLVDLSQLSKIVEEHRNEVLKTVKKKYKTISQTLLKIEGELVSTDLILRRPESSPPASSSCSKRDPSGSRRSGGMTDGPVVASSGRSALLRDYYYYVEKKVFTALTRMVVRSVKAFGGFRKIPRVVTLHFALMQHEIVEIPAKDEIENVINKIMNLFLHSTKEISRFMDGTCIPISPDSSQVVLEKDEAVVGETAARIIRQKYSYYNDIVACQGFRISGAFLGVSSGISKTLRRIEKLKESYERFSQYWKIPRETAIHKFADRDPSTEKYEERFEDCMKLILDIDHYSKPTVDINFVHVELGGLLKEIQTQARSWIEGYGSSLHSKVAPRLSALQEEMQEREDAVSKQIESIDDLRKVIRAICEVRKRYVDIEREYLEVDSIYSTLATYEISALSPEEVDAASHLAERWTALMEVGEGVSRDIVPLKVKYSKETVEDVAKLKVSVSELQQSFAGGPFGDLRPDEMKTLLEELSSLDELQVDLQLSETLFELPLSDFSALSELSTSMRSVNRVYVLYDEFRDFLSRWSTTPFADIQPDIMSKDTKRFLKRLREDFDQKMAALRVQQMVKQQIVDFGNSIPLFTALKSDDLRDRHWDRLAEKTGVRIDTKSADFTLQSLLDMELFRYQDELQEIFSDAKKEVTIENLILQISEGWRNRRFLLVDHVRDGVFRGKIIAGRQEIKEALEEDSASLDSNSGTRHSIPFLDDITKWGKILSTIEETVDLWIDVQRSWMNLEIIFIGSPDIRLQLPMQAKEFDLVEADWQKLMADVAKVKNIKETTNVHGRMDLLQKLHRQLQSCQMGLSNYLQTKRNAFPRFFYLSDEELLSILGSSDPHNVQKQITKLFNNVGSLIFRKNSGIVLGMLSNEREEFVFRRPCKTDAVIESWLADVEAEMRESLRLVAKEAVFHYPKIERVGWIMDNFGQIGLVGSQIWWTWEVEDAFNKVRAGDKMAVKVLSKKLTGQINDLVVKIRSRLTSQERKKVNTMIIIDVHARDIVDNLVRDSILDKREFEWESQLRFYWDRQEDTCRIRQCTGEFEYGFEYQGLNGRLVITPLTDRCFMTLTQALTFYLGGSPAGPAGTGKTESVKDLAKSMGCMCVVFNCSEGLDYQAMSRIFSGLCQNGAWGCFDEFNRIELPVLSVVSTQIRTIQAALSRKDATFRFDDADIPLNSTTGVFVTMNPGYAGRVELPDNLKCLFRPVTMVVPDLEIICEILLFSQGFVEARRLSRKMIKLYKLAKGQLSKQHHYDWGLRALKSILTKAGELKRDRPDDNENDLLMKALYEMNIAKFVFEDKPLFEDLLRDLFVSIEIDRSTNTFLFNAIQGVLEEGGYQLMEEDYQIQKITQLYETMNSRHSTMVVGGTSGGKSVVINTLVTAQTNLGYPTELFTINPKAQSVPDLYGVLDNDTREWKDGILSSAFREINIVPENSKVRRFLLFDGDVDTLWIESMNSVMDDNKLMTLANSERIALIDQCNLLFEVGDLKYASPATVSRCGMVFVDPKNLDQRPLIWKWLHDRFPDDEQAREQFRALFETYAHKCISFVLEGLEGDGPFATKPLDLILPRTDVNLIWQFCRLLDTQLPDLADITDPRIYESVFVFCLTWSIGGVLRSSEREKFDKFVKERVTRMRGVENPGDEIVPGGSYPTSGTFFDYFFDIPNNKYCRWSSLVTEYVPPSDGRFSSILVPTVDTVRYMYLLQKLNEIHSPVMFVGIPGTSKTVILNKFLANQLEKGTESKLSLVFSSRTTSADVQRAIEDNIEKKIGGTFAPKSNKHLNVFIDELNMPRIDIYGTQQPIAFLRFLIEKGGMYERVTKESSSNNWLKIVNMDFVGAFCPPCVGRNPVDPRFISLFNVFNLSFPSEDSLHTIFNSILSHHMTPFSEDVRAIGPTLCKMTLAVFRLVTERLPPTPSKFHYVFNLRDLGRVYQGLLSSTIDHMDSVDQFARLWRNECLRVFHDRLITPEDRQLVSEGITSLLRESFPHISDVIVKGNPIFGDFNVNFRSRDVLRLYSDMESFDTIRPIVQDRLDEFNEISEKQMDIVLFDDALEHLTRLERIIRADEGHALLIGVGGSGKKSLSTLATHLAGYELFTLRLCKGYNEETFQEDLKEMLRMAGVESKTVVFLFTDSDVLDECYLEYVNNLLTTGTIPALYPPDEKEDIVRSAVHLAREAKELGLIPTPQNIWSLFLKACKKNLHVILSMSPSESLKVRCRDFPGLINNTTIDWFDAWPKQALHSVAQTFLTNADVLGKQSDLLDELVEFMIQAHLDVVEKSKMFLQELSRSNCVTPKNYLDFISSLRTLLAQRRREVDDTTDRFKNGIAILEKAGKDVAVMQGKLELTKADVEEKQVEVQNLLGEIEKKAAEAGEAREAAQAKEKELRVKTNEIEVTKHTVESLLSEAKPILENAESALKNLRKSDITMMKAFKNPIPAIMDVGNCIVILLSDDHIEDPTWRDAQREFGDASFINILLRFDRNRVTGRKVRKIREIFRRNGPEFNPESITSKSPAAAGLLCWITAITKYYDALTQVKPLERNLERTKRDLQKSQAELRRIQQQLSGLEELLAQLNADLESNQEQAQRLQDKAAAMERKLKAAKKLILGLSSEKTRWAERIVELVSERTRLIGDCLLGSAFLSYLSCFTVDYRQKLVADWEAALVERSIPMSPEFSVNEFLVSDVLVAQWESEGLPSDVVSVQNGILTTTSSKFPLCIDPQLQALKWIKKREAKELKIRSFSSSDFYKVLENSLKFGWPFLFENVDEFIDPIIDPILNMDSEKRRVRIGDEEIDVDPDFRLYLCSRLSNPKYSPEVQGSTVVINYSVTFDGLIEQLLSEVVKNEKPQLEQMRKDLIDENSKNKSTLAELEAKILRELNIAATSGQSLIENEDLIRILDETKSKVQEINQKLKIANETSAQINETRERYRMVAIRGAVLFFVMSGLSSINSMYEYSLESFMSDVFVFSLLKSPFSKVLDVRLDNIVDFLTRRAYDYVCTGLFERDKLTFSLLLTLKILENRSELSPEEVDFFLKGDISFDKPKRPVPFSWMSPKGWKDLNKLPQIHSLFATIVDDVVGHSSEWKAWYDLETPETSEMPCGYSQRLTLFQSLSLLRCFRVDRILKSVTKFIVVSMKSNYYVRPPILDYKRIFKQSSNMCPLVCMISPGYDPASEILSLAARISQRCFSISLGQSQEAKAEDMIRRGVAKGQWVLLQNCHLLIDWMKELEKILNGFDPERVHAKFRLWMTSEVTKDFPISILQKSLKIVAEPPNSLKLNMVSCLSGIEDDGPFETCGHEAFKPLVYVLTYFHAVLQERKKYGKIGWNVPYDFNTSDYQVSFSLLETYLTKAQSFGDDIPWASLKYLVGEAMYGGRVTDDYDRRVLTTYLSEFMGGFLFDDYQPFHFFVGANGPTTEAAGTGSGDVSAPSIVCEIDYRLPANCLHRGDELDKQRYLDHTESTVKLENSPDVIGLHPNAEITYLTDCSKDMWRSLITCQNISVTSAVRKRTKPASSSAAAVSTQKEASQDRSSHRRENRLVESTREILRLVPLTYLFDRAALFRRIGSPGPIEVVLLQEVERWNALVEVVRESLQSLQRALAGEIRMSAELEEIAFSVSNGQIPSSWLRRAPPTQKLLSDWLAHFQRRYEQYADWVENLCDPPVMWLSGLHVPESYLTSIVQVTCKRKRWPLDKTVLATHVTPIVDYESEITEKPEDGCFVRGLFLEGARWDLDRMMLADQEPKVLLERLPVMKIEPIEVAKLKTQNTFRTPVYFTLSRASACGEGLVFEANLSTDLHASHWILKGVALVLNDS